MHLTTVLKVLGFVLGGLAVLVLGAALLAWVTFDAQRVRNDLTGYFATGYQRTLRIDGKVSLTMWPRPSLRLDGVALSEPKGSAGFIEAKGLSLPLAVGSMFSRRMVVTEIKADSVTAHLARDSKGTWNFADLLTPGKDVPPMTDALALDALDIRKLGGEIADGPNERQIKFSDLRVQTGALREGGAGALRIRGHVQAGDPTLDADVRASGHYFIETTDKGRIDDLFIHLAGRIAPLTGSETSLSADSLAWDQRGAAWNAHQLKVDVRGAWGQHSLQASAESSQLEWGKGAALGESASAEVVLRGAEDNVKLSSKLQGIGPATGGFGAESMHVKWQAQHGIVGSEGEASSPLRADWNAGRVEWERISGNLRVTHPRLNAENAKALVDGTALLSLAGTANATLKLTASTGKDKILLDSQITSLAPLAARIDVSAPHFDIDRLLAPVNGAGSQEMPLAWLGSSILSGSLNVDDAVFAGLKLDGIRMPYTYAAGKLASDKHRFSLYGGLLAGSGEYDVITRKLALDENFDNIDLGAMAKDAGTQLLLQGRATGSGQINTTGSTFKAFMNNANGMVRLNKVEQPVINGVDVAASLRQFRPALHGGQTAARTPASGERTELRDVSGNIGLRSGTLFTQSLTGRGTWLRLTALGEATPGKNAIDMTLQASVLRGTGPADLSDLRGKTVALRLQGTLAHPDVHLETAPVRAAAPAPVATSMVSVASTSSASSSMSAASRVSRP